MEEQVEVEEQVEGDSRSREWRLHRCEERVGRSGSVSALTSAQELCRYCCCSACRCCNLSATRQQSAARKSSSAERAAPGEGDGESEGVSDASGRVVSCGCPDVTCGNVFDSTRLDSMRTGAERSRALDF